MRQQKEGRNLCRCSASRPSFHHPFALVCSFSHATVCTKPLLQIYLQNHYTVLFEPLIPPHFLLMYLEALLLFLLPFSSLSSSWLSPPPVCAFFPSLTLLRALGTLPSAPEVSAVTSWIQWNSLLPCCHFSPISTATLLPKYYHAIISLPKIYRVSKLDCQPSVRFLTSVFFH